MHDLTEEMEKNKTIFPQDDLLLHKVLDSALNDEIGLQRKESNSKESKESNRDLKVKQVFSSETPFVRLGGFPWLVNCKQTEGGTNKKTNKNHKNLQIRKGNIGSDIRPDGLPERLPESLPERLPESLPESLPERLPESFPESLDLFIRPDGLPVTFVVAPSTAQLRRQVKIKRQVSM